MSINEKTLEIAVTHEILSLAEKFIYSSCLCKPILTSKKQNKIPYVLGLTLADEKRHGYDVKISLPNNFTSFGKPYIYYLQFKKGYHKEYSSNPLSLFFGDNTNKNKHILFGINNNSSKDQHIKLRNLWNLNYSKSNVLVGYALPLISNISNYKNCIGDLLSRTLIYEISDIDKLASGGLVGEINVNESHHIAVSYDGCQQEIRSTPRKSSFNDVSIQFYNEVFGIRIFKILNSIYKNQNELPSHEFAYITIDFIRNFFYSLNINSIESINELIIDIQIMGKDKTELFYDLLLSELNLWKSETKNFEINANYDSDIDDLNKEFLISRKKIIFKTLSESLIKLISEFIIYKDFKINDIIPLNYLKPMNVNHDNEIEISLKHFVDKNKYDTDFSIDEISYTLI